MPKKILPSHIAYPEFQEITWESLQVWFLPEYGEIIPNRRFKADFALPCCRLAIEIQGGAYGGKGHKGTTNYLNDIEKLNLYAVNKWYVMWFTPDMIRSLDYLTSLRHFFYNQRCSHLVENINNRLMAQSDGE